MKTNIFSIAFLLCSLSALAVNHLWQAAIDYELSYVGTTAQDNAILPQKQKTIILGSNQRTEATLEDGTKTTLISNRDSMLLINMSDNGIDCAAALCDSADIVSGRASLDIKVEESNQIKNILGYPCHRYDITITPKDPTDSLVATEVVWTTSYIGGEDLNFYLYPEVKGCILYSQRNYDGVTTTIKATSVENRVATPARSFLLPPDCMVESCQ